MARRIYTGWLSRSRTGRFRGHVPAKRAANSDQTHGVEVSGISWRNEQPPSSDLDRFRWALQRSTVIVNRFPVHQPDNLHERRSPWYFGVEEVALKVIPENDGRSITGILSKVRAWSNGARLTFTTFPYFLLVDIYLDWYFVRRLLEFFN